MLKTNLKFIDHFCNMNSESVNRKILAWLWLGFGMVFIQIILGAITRLTGSGLSITRWDIITGILYPLSEESWNHYFDLYKQTPQYLKINKDFSLKDFQFIFFWEYFHRLWARLMGFVFVIPFSYFLFKKWLDNVLKKRLLIIFLLACLVASLGWIMVASGLIERPWVNAYKLSFHLITAVSLLCYLFYTILHQSGVVQLQNKNSAIKTQRKTLLVFLWIQIFTGGIMAGMKAALAAPTWPKIQGDWIPDEVFALTSWPVYLFTDYELSHSGPLIIQFFHRNLAYLIFLLIIWIVISDFLRYKSRIRIKMLVLVGLCCVQIVVGIVTLVLSIGYISLWPAVLHQFFGICLLLVTYWIYYTDNAEYEPLNRG